jgi:hypothetical protein
LCLGLVVLALGVLGGGAVFAMPVRPPVGLFAVRLVADSFAPASVQSDNPDDFVQVHDGKFLLHDKPFVIKGTNYFGSWRFHHTTDAGNGIEYATAWAFFHEWDAEKVDLDFRFIRSQLNATAVRIGTPTEPEFANLVRYQHYKPWYNSDGTIAEPYKSELTKLADIAYANGIRIQFCLLWSVAREIASDRDAFKPGGQMDMLYANQVRSIVLALHDHPGVIAYSIGNEVLVNGPINGGHPSWFEGEAAGFILRRLQQVRALAPRQLVTTDEITTPGAKEWHSPGPEFAVLSGVDIGHGSQPVRLVDMIDYIGPHFYPETLRPEDLVDGFGGKIDDAKRKLAIYLQAAKAVGKPVVINEFGLQISPKTLPPEQYSAVQDRFFQAIIAEGQKLGLQGLLAWGAVPEISLIPGHYQVRQSTINAYSPVELDIDIAKSTQRRILFYDHHCNLFEWRDDNVLPSATLAAQAVAAAWADIPHPTDAPAQPSRH